MSNNHNIFGLLMLVAAMSGPKAKEVVKSFKNKVIGKHRIEWYETDANKRAWAYFHRYMYRWNYSQYPINYYKVNK